MIVNGYHEKDGATVFNSALVCTPDGKRMNQRKCNIQIPEDQMGPVAKGQRTRDAIFYKGFKLAILICADNGMDGIYEELSAQGFDAVLAPTAGLGHSKFAFHQSELSNPARLDEYVKASESVCFLKDSISRAVKLNMGMACCNQAGYVEEMTFFHCGHSAVVDRTGETTALIPGRFVAEHLRPDLNVGVITKR
jgi:predicted amidohydrolase